MGQGADGMAVGSANAADLTPKSRLKREWLNPPLIPCAAAPREMKKCLAALTAEGVRRE